MRRAASIRRVALAAWWATVLAVALSGIRATAQSTGGGYWHTSGKLILDADGTPVRIAGVNWFGLETSSFAPHGLWVRNYRDMLDQMKTLGFNTVRLPFSSQLFDAESRPSGIDYSLNPDLQDLSGIEVLDRIIAHAGKIGLKVILDRHRPDASGQSQLWYTSAYPESRWISDWKMLAARYKGDATVIGFDLQNEPRSPACWGCGEASLDWRLAAQRAGNAILGVNPNLLIIVEGVELHANTLYWWGGNLKGVAEAPVLLEIANRVVYSAHDYPGSISPQIWFSAPDYPNNLPKVWDEYWGFVAQNEVAPVLMGEFGSRLESDSDQKWFDSIVNYLGTNGLHWLFWSWNPNSGDTRGLLLDDWSSVDQTKLKKLKSIQSVTFKGTADDAPSPAVPQSSPQTQPGNRAVVFCASKYRQYSDWGTGYSADLTISNLGAGPVDGWTLSWRFAGTQKIRELWNGSFSQTGQTVTIKDAGWNAKLPEKSTALVGFVADYSGETGEPSSITLNGFPCVTQP